MTKIRDKSPLGSYPTYLVNLPDKHSGRYIGKARGTLTFSNYKKKIQMEDSQSHTSYLSSISTIVGTA